MIEGLWAIRFLTPDDPDMDLKGGVVVIETNRILGGDSGYFYVGSMQPAGSKVWNAQVRITRHDPNIISVFGDSDSVELSGTLQCCEEIEGQSKTLDVALSATGSEMTMTASMVKVADLP